MARNWFGEKKTTKEDMFTKHRVSNADIRWEIYKGILWFTLGYLFFHFVIMGWTL